MEKPCAKCKLLVPFFSDEKFGDYRADGTIVFSDGSEQPLYEAETRDGLVHVQARGHGLLCESNEVFEVYPRSLHR